MNPMQIIKGFMTKGMTPKGIVKNMIGNNPILGNLVDMADRGDTKGVEMFARNLLKERGLMLSSVESIEQYLDDNYERVCEANMTVGEFAYYNPEGIYLVTMPGHITAIKNGEIIDTFDCSERLMWCAWQVERLG